MNPSAFYLKAVANRSTLGNRVFASPEGTIVGRSLNQSMHLWLQKMMGAQYDLGYTIRSLAEKAFLQNRALEVIEVTFDFPLKALEIVGPGFRNRGDFLLYGDTIRAHTQTPVRATVIADEDYPLGLFQDYFGHDLDELADLYAGFIMPALNCKRRLDRNTDVRSLNNELAQLYRALKRSGVYTSLDGTTESCVNGTTALDRLEELRAAGRRFDLAFVDPLASTDRFLYFIGIQRVLSPGGYGYVPVNWWVPKGLPGQGVDERIVWTEMVNEGKGPERLEDYLARVYPDAFSIAHFPGAKTLVIKGSMQEINW